MKSNGNRQRSSRCLAGAAALLFAGLAFSAPARAAFTEFTEFGTSNTIPVAWGDFDNDGDYDLAVGDYTNGPNELWVNQGDGSFVRTEEFGSWQTFAMAWADYDNDGDLDMALANGGGQQNKLYVNQGDGTFVAEDQFGIDASTSLAWGDADNDGDLDLAVGNGILGMSGKNYLYRNEGNGTFTELFLFARGQTATLVWGDYDNDGDLDLAVGNGGFDAEGTNNLYRNEGGLSFSRLVRFGNGDTSSLAWGDVDGDGDLDMAVANWNAGQSYLYVNEGADSFTALPRFGTRDPNTIAWGDVDHDGDLDLAMGNGDFTTADSNYLYINMGGGAFTEASEFGLGSSDAVAFADYDDDGDLDLASGNEHHPTQNNLYRNETNDGASVILHLVGHRYDQGAGYSNRDGVGAKVTVYEAGFLGDPAHRVGYREVEAHGGFSPQGAIDPHFGVPSGATVDVRIVWPGSEGSNLVQDVTGVAVGVRTTVHESAAITGVEEAAGGRDLRPSLRAAPNPVRDRVSFRMASSGPAPAGLEVYDTRGRLVRELRLQRAGSGDGYGAEWDRRDDQGALVPSGVYFARVVGTKTRAARVVVVRGR